MNFSKSVEQETCAISK